MILKKHYKILFAFLLLAAKAEAGKSLDSLDIFSENKTVQKSFSVTENQELAISNKYGVVHINTWNTDSIRFEVQVHCEAPNAKDAKDMLEMTEITFQQSKNRLTAKTSLESKLNFFEQSILDISMSINPNHKITIDYVVYIPKRVALQIENKFGNVYLPDLSNSVSITLAHGDLVSGNLNNLKYFELKYGKAHIPEIGNCEMKIQFAELTLKKARELRINSISSEIEVDDLSTIWITSKNDEYKIGKVDKFYGNAGFSTIQVEELSGSFQHTAKYGTCSVYKILPQFTDLNADGSYTTYNLYFDPSSNFRFTVTMENEKSFTYPQSRLKVDDKSTFESRNVYTGKMGKGENSNVRISLKSGKLFLG